MFVDFIMPANRERVGQKPLRTLGCASMNANAGKPVEARALIARLTPYQEADLIVNWLTDHAGQVGTMARGARRSTRRFGSLEPLHTYAIRYTDGPSGGLSSLRDARLVTLRTSLAANLDAMATAGQAIRWVRTLFPHRQAEPRAFVVLELLLDALDVRGDLGRSFAECELAKMGLDLLKIAGYELQLDACVACDRPRPADRPAYVSLSRGGVVCRACGGGERVLGPDVFSGLERLLRDGAADIAGVRELVQLIDDAVTGHAV
jgi:DNA repair protein RecO (recombination protein O)